MRTIRTLLLLATLATPAMAAHRGPATIYPNPRLTPGATLHVTAADVCRAGYTKKVRRVPADVRRRVLEAYGFDGGAHGRELEVDHFIPLELGGSNAAANLWPELYRGTAGAHQKDRVENFLHREVCAGRMSLQEAQREIAYDWYAVFLRISH